MRYACLLAALVGCYSPSYEECAISCAQSGICPSGFECVQNVCRSTTGACPMTADAADVGTWRFRKKVTIAPTADLRSFPALITTSGDLALQTFTQPDGADIKFEMADGTKLPHEIERFDQASGRLIAWVQIPMLSLSSATELYMYYDNPDAAPQQASAAVWDASYLGVWHLSDPFGTTIADSTAAARTGTKGAPNTPSPVASGLIGVGHAFGGTTADFFSLPSSADLDSPTMTFEAWVKVTPPADAATAGYHRVFDVASNFANRPAVGYQDVFGTADPAKWQVQPLGPGSVRQTDVVTVTAQWAYIAATWDRSQAAQTLYIDGVRRTLQTTTATGAGTPGSAVTIGGSNGQLMGLNGTMDEARLSKVVRSAEYVATMFRFVMDPTTLVVIGAGETVP